MNALWFRELSRRLGLPAPITRHIARERDMRATARDGVVLLADRWFPRDLPHAPLILVRTPYGRTLGGLLFGRLLAHQGFQVVVQSCRGTGGSGADFDRPFLAEREDGEDTLRWMTKQQWYPGRFATIGASYFGYTQLALAEAAGNDLAAAVLQLTPTSVRDVAWKDEALSLGTALGWTSLVQRGPDKALRPLLARRRIAHAVDRAGQQGPLVESYTQATGRRVEFFEDWISHPEADDPWWEPLDSSRALEVIDCPVLVQAGWYDIFLESSLEQYRRLSARGVHTELKVGPWTHASFSLKGIGDNMTDAVAFLRRALEGVGAPPSAAVRLTEIGTGRRIELPTWPPEVTSKLVWHLGGSGTLTKESQLEGAALTEFRYDPHDPTPAVGGPTLADDAGPRDNSRREQRRDVLTFTTAPVEQDVEVLGSAVVELSIESDRSETCVFLRLCIVDPGGTSTNVTDRMVPLRSDKRATEGIWHVLESLPPTCLAVPQGSRLRLQVSSGAHPTYLRHSGTDELPAVATTFLPAVQRIHHSAERPATLSVPVALL